MVLETENAPCVSELYVIHVISEKNRIPTWFTICIKSDPNSEQHPFLGEKSQEKISRN